MDRPHPDSASDQDGGRIAAYIVTYRRPEVLQRAVDSFWRGVHDPRRVTLTVLNNHSDFTPPSSSGPLRVVHNDVRPDDAWGYLARDWNWCLLDAFGGWRGSDVEWCVLSQNDVEWLPDWQRRLDAVGPGTDFFSQPRGDQSMGFRLDALREVGFFDERFTTLGYQEQDYFTRAAIALGPRASINDDHFPGQAPWNPLPPIINTTQWHGYDADDPLLRTTHFGEELGNLLSHKWRVEDPLEVFDRPGMVRRWALEGRRLPEEINWYPFFWHGASAGPHREPAYTSPWTGPREGPPAAGQHPRVLPDLASAGSSDELLVRLPRPGLLAGVTDDLVDAVLSFAASFRAGDRVVLVLESGDDDCADDVAEQRTARWLLEVLGDRVRYLDDCASVVVRAGRRGSSEPALDLSLGERAPGALATFKEVLKLQRERASALLALTPVRDRVAWAQTFSPVRGFAHLVVDNASTDGTAEVLEGRGATVITHETEVSRTASWARAVEEARRHGGDRWVKWLFAGDLLDPGAADVLGPVIDAAPHVGLVVAEYVIDYGGGHSERWGSLPETRVVSPSEALRLSAERGNWFGSPIGHVFSPAGLEALEVGTSPYVADWHACLSVASKLPTLYVKHVIGTFSGPARAHWRSAGSSLHARVQELEVRLRSAAALGSEGSALLADVERQAAVHLGLHEPPVPASPPSPPATTSARVRLPAGETDGVRRPVGTAPVVAVQQPRLTSDPRDFHGYAALFAQDAQIAYLPQLGVRPELAHGLGVVDGVLRGGGAALEVVTSERELQRRADVVVCFEGRPYLPELAPPRHFTGLKAYHVMDYVFFADQAAEALRSGGADLLLGYARHDVHSPFFAHTYRGFEGRVRAVPFGFSDRFTVRTPFHQRVPRAIGLGAVNPVDDPLCPPGELDAYVRFHGGVRWTHAWRRRLVEDAGALGDVLDSRFPVWPETKDPASDAPALLDGHQAFVNDVGLMAFPPVRTYEGTASGAVLVAPAHPVYEEIGLQHGVNALFHRDQDVDHFRRVLQQWLAAPDQLAAVAAAGTALVRERYSHPRIAADLLSGLLSSAASSPRKEPARV